MPGEEAFDAADSALAFLFPSEYVSGLQSAKKQEGAFLWRSCVRLSFSSFVMREGTHGEIAVAQVFLSRHLILFQSFGVLRWVDRAPAKSLRDTNRLLSLLAQQV